MATPFRPCPCCFLIMLLGLAGGGVSAQDVTKAAQPQTQSLRRPSGRLMWLAVDDTALRGPYFGQDPPGDTPQIFADGIISGNNLHATPCFSPDGNELYWAVCGESHGRCRVYHSEMRSNGFWTVPEIASFTLAADGDNPVFHPDGERLFFNSHRPHNGVAKERIWYVDRLRDGTWSDPVPVDPIINDDELHWQTSVDRTGRLYFGSDRPPSFGSADIFASDLHAGHYSGPERLEAPVNTEHTESMPYIDPDGRFLLFTRLTGTSYGIFISRRSSAGTWREPIDLAEHCHTESGACPQLSFDGEYLFFLRHNGSDFDILWVHSGCIPDE